MLSQLLANYQESENLVDADGILNQLIKIDQDTGRARTGCATDLPSRPWQASTYQQPSWQPPLPETSASECQTGGFAQPRERAAYAKPKRCGQPERHADDERGRHADRAIQGT